MFSVVIPLFNKSDYIEKCVQSVISQTFKNFEIIIVNDGSTDDGYHRVLSFIHTCSDNSSSHSYIGDTDINRFGVIQENLNESENIQIVILNQDNSGVSVARNNGVRAAKFDYIAFLDADDWWDVHFLEEMKVLIEEFPDAGLYGCSYFYVKDGKTRNIDKGLPFGFQSGYINYFKVYGSTFTVPINCSFIVIPKSTFISAGGFNPALKYGEDLDLWVRVSLQYKVAYLNKSLSFSNQDADKSNRAVGNSHLFKPENHYIFNTDYLSEEEQRNPELKYLLDGLRVRSLIRFHLHNIFREKVNKELSKVDLNNQPFYFRFVYNYPSIIVRLFFNLRTFCYNFKKSLINLFFRQG